MLVSLFNHNQPYFTARRNTIALRARNGTTIKCPHEVVQLQILTRRAFTLTRPVQESRSSATHLALLPPILQAYVDTNLLAATGETINQAK